MKQEHSRTPNNKGTTSVPTTKERFFPAQEISVASLNAVLDIQGLQRQGLFGKQSQGEKETNHTCPNLTCLENGFL